MYFIHLCIRIAFNNLKEFSGKALKLIADGYPAYNITNQHFVLKRNDFELTQVIGLTNDEPISTEYR